MKKVNQFEIYEKIFKICNSLYSNHYTLFNYHGLQNIVHDMYLISLASLDKIDLGGDNARTYAYLKSLVKYQLFNLHRKYKREIRLNDYFESKSPSIIDNLILKEHLHLIKVALKYFLYTKFKLEGSRKLKFKVFHDRYMKDLSQIEIMEKYHLNRVEYKNKLYQATIQIKERIACQICLIHCTKANFRNCGIKRFKK